MGGSGGEWGREGGRKREGGVKERGVEGGGGQAYTLANGGLLLKRIMQLLCNGCHSYLVELTALQPISEPGHMRQWQCCESVRVFLFISLPLLPCSRTKCKIIAFPSHSFREFHTFHQRIQDCIKVCSLSTSPASQRAACGRPVASGQPVREWQLWPASEGVAAVGSQ